MILRNTWSRRALGVLLFVLLVIFPIGLTFVKTKEIFAGYNESSVPLVFWIIYMILSVGAFLTIIRKSSRS